MAAQRDPSESQLLKGTGFAEADTEIRKRVILSVEGREKEGKTSLSLSAPGPIGVINMDLGLEGVVHKFARDKKIYVSDYKLPSTTRGNAKEVAEEADKVWTSLMADYRAALRSFRTVVMDTATEVWELLRLARFGKLAQVMPHHYTTVNSEFREMLRMAYDGNANLILVHKMKAVWVDVPDGKGGTKGSRTGEYERSGFSDTGFIVQASVRVSRVTTDTPGDDGFRLQVLTCRQNAELTGQVLQAPMNTFPYLASMILPETSPETWQ
jgi:hypothetical protein